MAEQNNFTPNGFKTFYWPNGNIRMTGNWSDGRRTGEFKFYNEDGTLSNIINFSGDVLDGDVEKHLNSKVVMRYEYSDGTLQSSEEYVNNILMGEYGYSDALVYPDPDAPDPPPIGTLYHSYNGKHPGELFKGTLWTYVENSFEIDNNGNQVPVDIWLREPNGGRGPYVYNGNFLEYRISDGTILRKGSYIRKIIPGEASVSLLDGDEYLYRANGSTMYHGIWDQGSKVTKVEFFDEQNRVWKFINLNSDASYKDGYYSIWDIGLDGNIWYDFDKVTQNAALRFQK